MTRKEKYPDTDYFKYFNANPKNRITGDCIYRALSTALDIPYNQVVIELAELHCKTGYCDESLYSKYLESKGWVRYGCPKKSDNTRYTVKEWIRHECLGKSYYTNSVVAHAGTHHIIAIKDHKVHDIWNSSEEKLGVVWLKPKDR